MAEIGLIIPKGVKKTLEYGTQIYKGESYEDSSLLKILDQVDKEFVPSLSQRQNLNDYLEEMKKGTILYLTEDGNMVGLVNHNPTFQSEQYSGPYLKIIAVSPHYRNNGAGVLLIDMCIQDLKDKKVDKVALQTWSTNRAISLYNRKGFEIIKTIKDGRMPGIDTFWMMKHINE